MIFAKIILLELNNELNGNKIGPEQNIKIKENIREYVYEFYKSNISNNKLNNV